MNTFGSYKIYKELKIIVECHRGEINLNQFIESRKILVADKDYDPTFDQILDYRNAKMMVDLNELNNYTSFHKNFKPLHGKRKLAFLTDTPKVVVLSKLFSNEVKELQIKAEVFSTIEAIANFIEKEQIKEQQLTSIFTDVKNLENKYY